MSISTCHGSFFARHLDSNFDFFKSIKPTYSSGWSLNRGYTQRRVSTVVLYALTPEIRSRDADGHTALRMALAVFRQPRALKAETKSDPGGRVFFRSFRAALIGVVRIKSLGCLQTAKVGEMRYHKRNITVRTVIGYPHISLADSGSAQFPDSSLAIRRAVYGVIPVPRSRNIWRSRPIQTL
ncbi:uncharacterized protein BT62DRAFT_1011927 [Guyanagaster necrorhizus]|uniref:Uncharacterized protein n=1 Tax=Guyanagaster necrorhizus TaxID=856835 RepID=A0A9P8AMP9_9AGAR|nr:uncharacterized protein BT62DRAFT_1011927 [Guyanagaster necrorhizus MCA 3950]KAG7441125.1 hypothetical protein BT62DRAFT_1011927 [Guyanagaster necrorhizus MCA 3950]